MLSDNLHFSFHLTIASFLVKLWSSCATLQDELFVIGVSQMVHAVGDSLTVQTSLGFVLNTWGVMIWPRYSTSIPRFSQIQLQSGLLYSLHHSLRAWDEHPVFMKTLAHHWCRQTKFDPFSGLSHMKTPCLRRWGSISKGITCNSNRPYSMINAIFLMESEWTQICQYP